MPGSIAEGWLCPRCAVVHAPCVLRCDCKARQDPKDDAAAQEFFKKMREIADLPIRPPAFGRRLQPDCGCPPFGVCGNIACPRRFKIALAATGEMGQ